MSRRRSIAVLLTTCVLAARGFGSIPPDAAGVTIAGKIVEWHVWRPDGTVATVTEAAERTATHNRDEVIGDLTSIMYSGALPGSGVRPWHLQFAHFRTCLRIITSRSFCRTSDCKCQGLTLDFPGVSFVPLTVTLQGGAFATGALYFAYDASDPADLQKTYAGNRYLLPTGTLRLWKRDINGTYPTAGRTMADYIAPGHHGLSALGFGSPSTTVPVSATFYVESVRPVVENNRITVALDPDGPGPLPALVSRTLTLVGTAAVNLQVDSNNDGTINADDDLVEDATGDPTKPGKRLMVSYPSEFRGAPI